MHRPVVSACRCRRKAISPIFSNKHSVLTQFQSHNHVPGLVVVRATSELRFSSPQTFHTFIMKLHHLLPRALQLLGFLSTTTLLAHSAAVQLEPSLELSPRRLATRQTGITLTSLTYSGTGCPSGTPSPPPAPPPSNSPSTQTPSPPSSTQASPPPSTPAPAPSSHPSPSPAAYALLSRARATSAAGNGSLCFHDPYSMLLFALSFPFRFTLPALIKSFRHE